MTEAEFSQLPFGSEGLWRKLMHACRSASSLEEIRTAVKSKRYTMTRIDRMILCAYLGLTESDLQTTPPYVRVLGFGQRGRIALNKAREYGTFLHIGEASEAPYWQMEQRCDDLYGLFRADAPAPAGKEALRRISITP